MKGRGAADRGLSRLPHDFENGRLYNFQLSQAIRNIKKRQKTGRTDDLNPVGFDGN